MLLDEALAASDKADGWLTKNEQTLLYNLAKEAPKGKAIVELGSWMGKATIMLAAGSMAGSKVPVYAVDYFTITGSVGHDYESYLQGHPKDYFSTFSENINGVGLSSIIRPIKASTITAAQMWNGPEPHLLFIDADHRYNGVRSDFLAWTRHCSPGAIVAFHDFNAPDYPGVKLFVSRLAGSRIIVRTSLVDSIKYGELAVNDVAGVNRRLRYFPYVLAWALGLSQRIVHMLIYTHPKQLSSKMWNRLFAKWSRWISSFIECGLRATRLIIRLISGDIPV